MAKKTAVTLVFPNIEREFHYEYDYDLEQNRTEQAMRQWYDEHADELFALYGYGPMDVTVKVDDEVVSHERLCYQETLWHSFFREGGETWHGRFSHFTTTLYSFRYCEDQRTEIESKLERKAA